MGGLCSRSDKKYAVEKSVKESPLTSDEREAVVPLGVSLGSDCRTDDSERPPFGSTKGDGRGDNDEAVTKMKQNQYVPEKNKVRRKKS